MLHEHTLRSRSSTLLVRPPRRNAASNLLLKYANITSYFAQVPALTSIYISSRGAIKTSGVDILMYVCKCVGV